MATGIEICDQNGKMQFNGDMLTYALRVSGTTYVENRKIGNTCPTSFIVPTSQTFTQALIAIGGGNGYAAAFGGLYTINGQQIKIYGTNGAPAGTPFNYYIFERSNTIPASNFGMEVRNANNEITFSTNQRVMRVLTMIGGVVVNGEQYASYGGRQLAFCQGAWSGHRISGPKSYYGGGGGGSPQLPDQDVGGGSGGYSAWNNDGKIYGGFISDGGQTVGTRMVSWDDVRIGPAPDQDQPDDYYKPLNLFVADVTGFPIGAQFF